MCSRYRFAMAAIVFGLCLVLQATTAFAANVLTWRCPIWTGAVRGEFLGPDGVAFAYFHSSQSTPNCAVPDVGCEPLPNGAGGKNFTEYACTNSANCTTWASYNDRYSTVAGVKGSLYCGEYYLNLFPNASRNAGGKTCCGVGDPINDGTGNKFQIETDFPRAGALEFVRTYNSWLPRERTALGAQWRHNWDRSIFSGDGLASVQRGDGNLHPYSAPSSGTTWVGDGDVNDRLDRLADGGWLLTTAANVVEAYDSSGKLTSVTSANGDVTTLSYSDGTATGPNGAVYDDFPTQALTRGLLIRVTDFRGRSLQFKYDAREMMTRMIDPSGGVYKYTVTGTIPLLNSVQFPDLNTRTYLYNEPAYLGGSGNSVGALTGIVDENGVRYSSTTYADGKAASTELAGGIDRFTFTYDSASGYVDPLGASRTSSFVVSFGTVRKSGTTRPCPGCTPGTASEASSLDANGNVTSNRSAHLS